MHKKTVTYPTVSTGSGSDNITLKVSENSWANGDGISDANGDAEFTVSVNGVQQGGVFTALAPQGADQTFVFSGTFGANPTLAVTFINDAFGGTAITDRNLYVDSISYDGVGQSQPADDINYDRTDMFQLQGGTTTTGGGSTGGGGTTSGPSFYVSATGSDFGDGSQTNPFATLARAQQAMQGSTIKTTEIESGTYSLGSWNLSSADSGETWISHSGAVLDGHGSGYVNAPHVNNLTIEGLTFQNLGIAPNVNGGVNLSGDSGDTIRWNTFLNSDQEVISSAGLQSSLIDSNTFNGVGPGNPPGVLTFEYSAIDLWYGSSGNTISHNLIENAQGGGIEFNDGATDPAINNNVIDSNKLVNVDMSVYDSGAIYMMDRTHSSTGNKITNNVVDGYGNGSMTDLTKGIYLDDGMSNVQVTGNLIYGTAGEWGIQFHGGSNDVVQNNIFALQPGEELGLYQSVANGTSMTGNDFQNNIVYYQGQPPSSLWEIDGSPSNPLVDSNNLYWSTSGSVPTNSDSHPFTADPQFVSPGGGNFMLASSSPAYSDIGWQTLATNQGPLPSQV